MRFFSLRQTSRAVLVAMSVTGAIALSLNAQAATVSLQKRKPLKQMSQLDKIA